MAPCMSFVRFGFSLGGRGRVPHDLASPTPNGLDRRLGSLAPSTGRGVKAQQPPDGRWLDGGSSLNPVPLASCVTFAAIVSVVGADGAAEGHEEASAVRRGEGLASRKGHD